MDKAPETSSGFSRRRFVQGVGTLSLGVATTTVPLHATATESTGEKDQHYFLHAHPVWPKGVELEKNILVGFRAVVHGPLDGAVVLRIAASTIYRCFVNGEFCGYGPARAGHGYYRVDEWDIGELIRPGKNVVAIEVAGYNVNSYYVLDQPSFLQAEVRAGVSVVAATGGTSHLFQAVILRERVRKVQRYSFQRPFSEVYRLQPQHQEWRTTTTARVDHVPCKSVAPKKLLPRNVPNPLFYLRQPDWRVSEGRVETGFEPETIWKDRSLTEIGPTLKGFPEKDLDVIPSIELQTVKTFPSSTTRRRCNAQEVLSLGEKSYTIVDLGTNLTGFIGAEVICKKSVRLFFTFDEILTDGDVDFKRLKCVNIVLYELEPGTYHVESFEPYTLRYLKLIVLSGECDVKSIYLREYANPNVERAHFAASDDRLNQLFAAGRETYRQNALDLFTDCPSRERAGWLCDSYFTAQAAQALAGDTVEERNFLENFLLPESFPSLPKGMLPMCYPADHIDGNFIPNWGMWFVIQVEDYLRRSGDRALVEALRPRVLELAQYFQAFKNEDGLLEKLKGWVFVEWSDANKFVQDVNYPTNMLYAASLQAVGAMYSIPGLKEEAEKIRRVILKQSFDGDFFVDNAIRENGKLSVTRNRSEICQYSAFYFGVVTPESHPALWQNVRDHLGPRRTDTGAFPEVHEANAFIGNVMRLELLSRVGLAQQILDESISSLLYMADRTGTLWENVETSGSCDHGFASHIVRLLYRDVLGLYEIDSVKKVVRLRFPDVRLAWCRGRVPVEGGVITLIWRKKDGKNEYHIQSPAGYTFSVEGNDDFWIEMGSEIAPRP
jgi:alpha-L-rhamnosidase